MRKEPMFSKGRIFFYLLSLLVFYLAIHYVGRLKDIHTLILQMSPVWLLLALIAQATTYVLNVMILRTLLNGDTGNAGFLRLFKLSVVILFINQALPSGGLSGNGYMFRQLVKQGVHSRAAFNTLMLESISYYIAFLFLLGSFYAWFFGYGIAMGSMIRYTVAVGFVFFICLGVLMLIACNQRAISYLVPKLNHIGWLKNYIAQTGLLTLSKGKRVNWQDLFKGKTTLLLAILCQIGILSCDGITIFAILKGFDTWMDAGLIMFGFLLSQVIGSLPVSPGALIAYESAMTYFYVQLGLEVHTALVVTMLFRFFSFWLPIPIGLLLYRNLRNH